ncbi:MAG TPA: metallophosphoesterase [Acidimicrobiales bacterium]
MPVEVTTVADDMVVVHTPTEVRRYFELSPDTVHVLDGVEARTLPRPGGELLARVATVNDVHFGEFECGRIDDHPMGPILRAAEGEPPYPLVMNRGAIAEITSIDPDAVLVKGDLTNDGRPEEFAAFREAYGVFGERLSVIRGNHDAYRGQDEFAGDVCVDVPGARMLMLDTTIPTQTTGRVTTEQLAWLEALAAEADSPVLLFGHHQVWVPGGNRDPGYFGINPDDSEALLEVIARHPNIAGYFAGHTHRNRVRPHPETGTPLVEVGCVKDFPGSWAEYRVFEGGVLQVHHRISSPEALAWSERCRHLYRDFGVDYESYALATLDHRCFTLPGRN